MKDLFKYYQDELFSLRKHGGYFAKKYPDIAGAIDLKNAQSADPHTERIIESVAFMAAKLRKKIDENGEKLAEYILGVLHPYISEVFPSCCLISLSLSDKKSIADSVKIPKGSTFIGRKQDGGYCTFKSLYPINIYPLFVSSSLITDNQGVCHIKLNIKSLSIPIEDMNIDSLLIYIDTDVLENDLLIYESVFSTVNSTASLELYDQYTKSNVSIKFPKKSIVKKGFTKDEMVCPTKKYTNNSYQLFQEMIFFPQKFLFFDIRNIGDLIQKSGITNLDSISIVIQSALHEEIINKTMDKEIFKVNVVPAVNLFELTSDPIRFDNMKTKTLLLADQKRDKDLEIQSIISVHIIDNTYFEDKKIQPYFSLEIDSDKNIIHDIFWFSEKESAKMRDLDGFDTYISIINTNLDVTAQYNETIYAKVLCTNRFSARELSIGTDLIPEGISIGEYQARIHKKVTTPQNISDHSNSTFEIVSQLSCSNVLLYQHSDILPYIKKILQILSGNNRFKYKNFVKYISKIEMKYVIRRLGIDAWKGFVRGVEIQIYVSDDDYVFFVFFLASIINEYCSSIVSINSFVETVVISKKTGKELSKFPLSSGKKDII